MDIKTLIAVATGKIPHNYRSGLCPNELQPDSRDPDCPACKILTEAEARAEREAGKLLAYLSNDRTQFFIPSMEGKDVKHAPYMAHWMAGWTHLYAAQPVTAQAEGYVTALRYIAWEAAGYMDCVHAAKRAIGEMGALPPPPKIQPTEAGGLE